MMWKTTHKISGSQIPDHPEWVEPNGESAMCDSYEARPKELAMQGFSRLFPSGTVPTDPSVVTGASNRRFMPTRSGALLSRGVSIKGSVKFLNGMFIDGEVEGTIDSTGSLRIGEHAHKR
jgi:hypothetical protein